MGKAVIKENLSNNDYKNKDQILNFLFSIRIP